MHSFIHPSLCLAYSSHGWQPWNSFQHKAEQKLKPQSTHLIKPEFCGSVSVHLFNFVLQVFGLPASFHFHTHHRHSR